MKKDVPWPNDHYTPLARRARLPAVLLVLAFARLASAQSPPCAECVTLVMEPGQVLALRGPLNGLKVAVRVPAADADAATVPLAAIRESGGAPGLVVTGVPLVTPDGALNVSTQLFVDISRDPSLDFDDLAFRLKTRFTEIRGASPAVRLGLLATAAQHAELRKRGLPAYLDAAALATSTTDPRQPRWLHAGSPLAAVQPPDATEQARGSSGDAVRWLWNSPSGVLETAALARDLAQSMRLLGAELLRGGMVDVFCGERRADTYLNPRTLDTVAFAAGCGDDLIRIEPDARPAERVRLSSGDVLVRVAASADQFADDVRVVGARELTVQEILARHQAMAARQRALVRTMISTGSLTLTFEAPGFPAPVAISSETVIYAAEGQTDIEQRSVRVNGIEFKGGGVPRLPIIEPERVASPPLAIALSDRYRYTLEGRDRIGGIACYVVSFEPIDSARPLFRGRAWIAADTFAMLRVAAAQTGLRGPIVSSEQVDEFGAHGSVWLVTRSEIRQIYEGAGHRTPIHRVLAVTSHEINPADFEARREAAYASPAIMLRDTAEGFRYVRRERPKGPAGSVAATVTDSAHSVKTLALGLIVDPNISRPLPFAGLSYVDFNLFGTGTQINAFFGGTYGQLAFSVPSLRGTRWQLAGRAFGIASSYNDRAFHNGRETYERNITQRPAHVSVWALRPVTPRLTVRAGYELDYTQFSAAGSTAREFTTPADQVAHSMRVALEGQRAGWNVAVWWTGSRRAAWKRWGTGAEDYAPRHADYQRYGAGLTRSLVLGPALVGRVEFAWMSGQDLDRFSRYAFGTFDNRLRGYPSALIRYDNGGVVRTAAAWAAGRRLRVDGFIDSAYVHDPGFGQGLRHFSGVGAALEAPLPFGMLGAVEWGYGFQGVNTRGRSGTQVVRVSAFKLF